MNVIREHIFLSILFLFSLLVFFILSFALLTQEGIGVDAIGYMWAQKQTSHSMFSFMLAMSQVFHPIAIITLVSIFFVILLIMKKNALAWIMLLSTACGAIASVTLKYFFDVARPVSFVVDEITPAFPSAHATIVAILAVMMIVLLKQSIGDKTIHTLFGGVMVSSAFLTGVSRIYISVHWLTDVAGGFALGTLIGSGALLLYARIHEIKHGSFPIH